MIPTDDGTYHVWAPDVVYNRAQDLYYMYFCTSSTWNASNLCYAVSDKPEGPYTWKGALIYSGFAKDTIEATDVLDYVDISYAKRTTSSREINITMRNIQMRSIRPSFMMRTEKCGWSMARGQVEFSC